MEQIADGCCDGRGGTVYQLAPDRIELNVNGMYSGLLTLAQAQHHPRRTEALAQKKVRQESRKQHGRIPAD